MTTTVTAGGITAAALEDRITTWLDLCAFHAGLITRAEVWDAIDVRAAHAAAARITRERRQS